MDELTNRGFQKTADLNDNWALKLQKCFQSYSWDKLNLGTRFLKGRISRSENNLILFAPFLKMELAAHYIRERVGIYYVDSLAKPNHYAQYLPIAANCFERGCLSDKEPPPRSEDLVGIANFGGADTMRGYDRVFASPLISQIPNGTIGEIEKVANIIGGKTVQHIDSDWAYEVEPLASVRIRFAFWKGDEELSSYFSILFGGETNDTGIPLEDLKALTFLTISRFASEYRLVSTQNS